MSKERAVWGRLHIAELGEGDLAIEGTFQPMCEQDLYIGEPYRVVLSLADLMGCLSTYTARPAFHGRNQDEPGFFIDGYFRIYTSDGPARITSTNWATSYEQED